MRTRVVVTSLAGLLIAMVSAFGQEGAITKESQLRKALATAKTPADHARIAYYYHSAASSWSRAQSEEEQIAAQLQEQYAGWTKSPNPYMSAKNLAAWYGKLATDAVAHAAEQDKLANVQTASLR